MSAPGTGTRQDGRAPDPTIAGLCLVVAGIGSGHAVLGIACGLTVAAGLRMRRDGRRRAAGSAVFLAGALAFAVGLLFTTGYEAGKDMASRDSSRVAQLQAPSR